MAAERSSSRQLHFAQVDLAAVPYAQAQGTGNLHVFGLPMDKSTDRVRQGLHQFLHAHRHALGVDRFPADVVKGYGVGGEVERFVLPNELRRRPWTTL